MCAFITSLQELQGNMPQKERRAERVRIDKIIEFFRLPISLS